MYGVCIDESMDSDEFEYLIADNYDPSREIPNGFIICSKSFVCIRQSSSFNFLITMTGVIGVLGQKSSNSFEVFIFSKTFCVLVFLCFSIFVSMYYCIQLYTSSQYHKLNLL